MTQLVWEEWQSGLICKLSYGLLDFIPVTIFYIKIDILFVSWNGL